MSRGFHILRDGDRLTLARRLAHLVRQDLWRALQRVRGFSPVVEVTRHSDHLAVRAGGRVEGAIAPGLAARAQAVLDDPRNRQRWQR